MAHCHLHRLDVRSEETETSSPVELSSKNGTCCCNLARRAPFEFLSLPAHCEFEQKFANMLHEGHDCDTCADLPKAASMFCCECWRFRRKQVQKMATRAVSMSSARVDESKLYR